MTTLTRLSVLIAVVFSVLAATEVVVHVYQALSFVAKTVASFAAVLIAYKMYAIYIRFMERVERLFTHYDKMCQYMQWDSAVRSVTTVRRLACERLTVERSKGPPDTTWSDPLTKSGYVPVNMAKPFVTFPEDGVGEEDGKSNGTGDGNIDEEYVVVDTDYQAPMASPEAPIASSEARTTALKAHTMTPDYFEVK